MVRFEELVDKDGIGDWDVKAKRLGTGRSGRAVDQKWRKIAAANKARRREKGRGAEGEEREEAEEGKNCKSCRMGRGNCRHWNMAGHLQRTGGSDEDSESEEGSNSRSSEEEDDASEEENEDSDDGERFDLSDQSVVKALERGLRAKSRVSYTEVPGSEEKEKGRGLGLKLSRQDSGGKKWTEKELKKLRDMIRKMGPGGWESKAKLFENRTAIALSNCASKHKEEWAEGVGAAAAAAGGGGAVGGSSGGGRDAARASPSNGPSPRLRGFALVQELVDVAGPDITVLLESQGVKTLEQLATLSPDSVPVFASMSLASEYEISQAIRAAKKALVGPTAGSGDDESEGQSESDESSEEADAEAADEAVPVRFTKKLKPARPPKRTASQEEDGKPLAFIPPASRSVPGGNVPKKKRKRSSRETGLPQIAQDEAAAATVSPEEVEEQIPADGTDPFQVDGEEAPLERCARRCENYEFCIKNEKLCIKITQKRGVLYLK